MMRRFSSTAGGMHRLVRDHGVATHRWSVTGTYYYKVSLFLLCAQKTFAPRTGYNELEFLACHLMVSQRLWSSALYTSLNLMKRFKHGSQRAIVSQPDHISNLSSCVRSKLTHRLNITVASQRYVSTVHRDLYTGKPGQLTNKLTSCTASESTIKLVDNRDC